MKTLMKGVSLVAGISLATLLTGCSTARYAADPYYDQEAVVASEGTPVETAYGTWVDPNAQMVRDGSQVSVEQAVDPVIAVVPTSKEGCTNQEATAVVVPTAVERNQVPVTTKQATTATTAAVNNQVRYSVQVGLLGQPDMRAYNDLKGVRQVKRADGYAYYYGSYATKAQADTAARELRARGARYADAFVVTLRGDQRVY
jgi:hypothetical protein